MQTGRGLVIITITNLKVLFVASDVVLLKESQLVDKPAVLNVKILQQDLVQNHSQVKVLRCSLPANQRHPELVRISGGPNMETEGVSLPLLLLYPACQIVPHFHGQNILVIEFI